MNQKTQDSLAAKIKDAPSFVELKELLHDLISMLEKSGYNDTGLPQPYMNLELARLRQRALDLTELIEEEALDLATDEVAALS